MGGELVTTPEKMRLLAAVETAPGSGEFGIDERLAVEEVRERCDGQVGSARVSVRMDDALDCEEVRRRYHPERRLLVLTDAETPAGREVLFDGYAPLRTWRWDGRIGRESEEYVFEAEHVIERLGRVPESLVYGRRVRNAAIEDAWRATPERCGETVLVTALTCVFNPDGVGNRSADDIRAVVGGRERRGPIFTWDGDRNGLQWTFADVLRYLVWFYLPPTVAIAGDVLLDATESEGAGGMLAESLARTPVSLACEGMSLLESLHLCCAAAGLHLSADSTNTAGRVQTSLRVWAKEDGPKRELLLARGGRYADGQPRYRARSAGGMLLDNNTHRGDLSWDERGLCDYPVVLGDVKRYEMTLPLCPGWIPRDGLDNVAPSGRSAAKSKALTPATVQALGARATSYEWYQRYHRQGSSFRAEADVSRLWVLNEDGFFAGDMYSRNPPFDDYRAFDFSRVADATVLATGGWMRRARRLLPPLSRTWDGRQVPVWVEVSFDGGETWHQQASGVRVLQDRIGIYFECENPTEIAPGAIDPRVSNMWYALVDGTFRVRVTGVVESDERLVAAPRPGSQAVGLRRSGRVLLRTKAFQYASRQHTTDVLADLGDSAERDDTAAIEALADEAASGGNAHEVRGVPMIPWIETGYRIGDRISEIRGRQVRLAMNEGVSQRCPAVVGRRFVLRDGAYETELTLG
jgi:hypothetical protein